MQQLVDEIVPIGTKIRVRSDGADSAIEGMIEGYGTVIRSDENADGPDEQVTVYEVEVTKAHVGYGDKVTLEGERLLLYRGAFTIDAEYDVTVKYSFSARIKAENELAASQALRDALVEVLTFDGDDNAPEPLVEMEMRSL